MKQIFKINYKLSNWNDIIGQCRANKYYANKYKKQEMEVIRYSLIGLHKVKKYPIQIEFRWHIKNSISDLDNKSCKAILDQMQHQGIIENDNIKHINKITHYAIKDKEEYVEVIMEEENDIK